MSLTTLTDYISSFEQENQSTLSLVRSSIDKIEEICSKKNRKGHSLDMASALSAKDAAMRFLSWPGTNKPIQDKVLTPDSSSFIEIGTPESVIGKLLDFSHGKFILLAGSIDNSCGHMTQSRHAPSQTMIPRSAKPSNNSTLRKDCKPVTFFEPVTGKETKPEKPETPQAKLMHRVPFFTLNIKTHLRGK